MDNEGKLTRREAVGLFGVASAGVAGFVKVGSEIRQQQDEALGVPELEKKLYGTQNGQNNGEIIKAPEIERMQPIIYLQRDESDTLSLSTTADYLNIDGLVTAPTMQASQNPRARVYTNDETFMLQKPVEISPDEIDTSKVAAVRVGSSADNQYNNERYEMTDPNNDRRLIYVWLALADKTNRDPKNPVWVDFKGNVIDRPMYISPIFADTSELSDSTENIGQ